MEYVEFIQYASSISIWISWVYMILIYRLYFQWIYKWKFSIFQFLKWSDDSNLFKIALLFSVLIWMLIFISLICEPGARFTIQFEMVEDKLSECDWYLLPIEMQQMYIIFLSNIQNSLKMLSYADITCERETLKKVLILSTIDIHMR